MIPRKIRIRACQNSHADQSLAGQAVKNTPIDQLKEFPHQPRVHSPRQIGLITRSIDRFGFISPPLVNKEGHVISGWGRVLAAKKLGRTCVPTLQIEHLNKDEQRAYAIAENRLAEKAGWDRSRLSVELKHLIEIGSDLVTIGFEAGEADIIFEDLALANESTGPEEDVPLAEEKAVTKLDDLWQCGPHLVLCGDARENLAFTKLLGGEKAALIVTDPPYNVKIDGHVSGLGKNRHREFAMASGEMSSQDFCRLLEQWFQNMAAHSLDGSVHYIFIDWRHVAEMMTAGNAAYRKLLNICVWCKTNAGMGSHYRSQHEFVFVWLKGDGAYVNNIELGRHGRSRSNVWTYAGANTFKSGRDEELKMHPTVKPVALVADAIKDSSLRNALVLDPFLGSGTTLIAAERTGRRARGIEIDPLYVDVTVRRWQAYTGKFAIHVETGLTFDRIELRRSRVRLRR